MKRFIILFYEKINLEDKFIKENGRIELIKNKVTNILSIILNYMEKKQRNNNYSKEAYVFYLKAFLFSDNFDYALIYFTRYLIYDFIKLNENKKYKEVDILNLLPKKIIEKKNKSNYYLFRDYYSNHLLQMTKFAEFIDIIMVPFTFKCNLNIFSLVKVNDGIFPFIDDGKINYKCGSNTDTEINLLYTGNHYNIVYKEEYYKKYSNELNNIFIKNKYKELKLELSLKEQYLESNKINKTIIKTTNKCLICNSENKNIYREFHCGLKICSETCFNQYLKPKKNKESQELEDGKYYDHITYCICGKSNNKNDIKEMILGKEKVNIKDEYVENENYKKIVENHWKWKCNLCKKNESFDRRFRYYRLIFKNEKNPFTNQQLEHLVCFTCKNNIKENKIKCHYCDKEHTISSIKNVSEENENESSCNFI